MAHNNDEQSTTSAIAPPQKREPQKRYLVLGSEGHGSRVASYRWDKLPSKLNAADYDVVILNMTAFEDAGLAKAFPTGRLPSTEQLVRLMFSPGAEVVVIGRPHTHIGEPPGMVGGYRLPDQRLRADYWLPGALPAQDDNGRSYQVVAQEWQFYFEQLSDWTWILTGTPQPKTPPQSYLKPVATTPVTRLEYRAEPLALTRYAAPIAVELKLWGVHEYRYNPRSAPVASSDGIAEMQDVIAESCSIFWLPAPDRCAESEAIDLILQVRYGIRAPAREPEWALGYELPAERPVQEEIARAEEERHAAETRLAEARARALEAARPKQLLYEKGKDVLEPLVRDVLRQLGARVEDPTREGIEDGRLYVRGQRAVIEIKGRDGPIKQDDVRQVVQWQTDARLEHGIEHKAIIFGNPHCHITPDLRPNPLAPNAKTYAKNGGVAFVSTLQLYDALRRKQEGELDEEMFWNAVFAAKGVAELPEAPAPAPPAT